ncbi:MAG: hypothetical protein GEU94_07725, partial [Micromonosporaceae bacterium]|nr:hypothetical protein [Micromonosporaceae bacterium]
MPEFEPLTSEDRQLIGEPEPPPAPPRRRQPWRWTIAAGLVLAGLAVVLARPDDAPDRASEAPGHPAATPGHPTGSALPTSPSLPAVESPVRLVDRDDALDLPGEVVSFDVAADGHAAAVATDCVTPSRCRASLAVSRDGDRWTRRELPLQVTGEAMRVWSLGGGVLVIEEPGTLRLRSADNGQTWRRVPLKLAEPVEDASAGTLFVTAPDQVYRSPCAGRAIAVLGKDDGRSAPLRSQPRRVNPCAAVAHGDGGGGVWAAGVDPVSGQPAVAHSPDHGATWKTSPLPDVGEAVDVWPSIAGPQVYVVVFGPTRESPRNYGVTAVFRKAGDGWVRTVRRTDPSRDIQGMIACPDGM